LENYPGLAEGLFQGIPAIVRVFPFLADVKLPSLLASSRFSPPFEFQPERRLWFKLVEMFSFAAISRKIQNADRARNVMPITA
jgi:hypothetical protein